MSMGVMADNSESITVTVPGEPPIVGPPEPPVVEPPAPPSTGFMYIYVGGVAVPSYWLMILVSVIVGGVGFGYLRKKNKKAPYGKKKRT
jgi:hypothetical protein